MKNLQGNLVLPKGIFKGKISFLDKIKSIELSNNNCDDFILPGFVDTHIHGGGNGDVMEGENGIKKTALAHLEHGTTSFLPTTITTPIEEIFFALKEIKQTKTKSRILGAHLEGPFISEKRLGAQGNFCIEPEENIIRQMLDLNIIKAITVAPEINNANLLHMFDKQGIRIGIGHTAADSQTTTKFINSFSSNICSTHFFNAMTGISARQPGAATALLLANNYHEIILDFHHVHKDSFFLVNKLSKKIILITDAIKASCTNLRETTLANQKVFIVDNKAYLDNKTIAGSMLTMLKAFKNAVEIGIPIHLTSKMCSYNPAKSIYYNNIGLLKEGFLADLLVLDNNLNIKAIFINGKQVY